MILYCFRILISLEVEGVSPTGKSISVSVRVVRDVRAGGRGEAAWARESGDAPISSRS